MARSAAALLVGLAVLAGCRGPELSVQTWGTMREVLRDGDTAGRVRIAEAIGDSGSSAIGVGALEGLAAEVTIDGGVVHLGAVEGGEYVARDHDPSIDRAALLAVASVEAWERAELDGAADLDALADAVRTAAVAAGHDPAAGPLAVRIEGRFEGLDVHVLDGSCPIADPFGPPPWRLEGAAAEGVLVGFYAEDAAGVLTHHGDRFHLHALVRTADGREVTGHVDEAAVAGGAIAMVPAVR